MSQGSVTLWISQLRAGDRTAAGPLWRRYFEQLVAVARTRLLHAPRHAADEEDVALSAFHSFWRAAERGRFPKLDDREDLWRLLVMLTTRKAAHLVRDGGRLKRGGGEEKMDLDLLAGAEPEPEFVVQAAEECRRLLGRLHDDTLRAVVMWKMEGHTNEEIAAKLTCVTRTVERKLRLIRKIWEDEE